MILGRPQTLRSDPGAVRLATLGTNLQLLEGPFTDLAWLAGRPVTRLQLTGTVLGSLEPVNSLPRLVELRLGLVKASGRVRLEGLPHLRTLAVGGRAALLDLGDPDGSAVREVAVENPGPEWLPWLEPLPALRRVQLARARALPAGFSGPLEEFDLASTRWPSGAGPLTGIETLTSIELTGVSGLADLRPFAGARSIRRLVVEDCVDFASTSGATLAPGCEVLLIGRTPARHAR